jgi:hypothetical protein
VKGYAVEIYGLRTADMLVISVEMLSSLIHDSQMSGRAE